MHKSSCRDTLCHVVRIVAVTVAVTIEFWGGHGRLDCRYLDNSLKGSTWNDRLFTLAGCPPI